jgi:hypothetical protein
MLERSLNQRACIRIIHVVEIESTPTVMTGGGTFGLQLCGAQIERKCGGLFQLRPRLGIALKNVTEHLCLQSLPLKREH